MADGIVQQSIKLTPVEHRDLIIYRSSIGLVFPHCTLEAMTGFIIEELAIVAKNLRISSLGKLGDQYLFDTSAAYRFLSLLRPDAYLLSLGELNPNFDRIAFFQDVYPDPDEFVPTANPKTKNKCLKGQKVYFVSNQLKTVFKIGISKNPKGRLKELQTSNSSLLSIEHIFIGGKALESFLHKSLAQYRLSGEWFSYECFPEAVKLAKAWRK